MAIKSYKLITKNNMSKIKKDIRLLVWNKYNKHCSYCGCSLEYNKMEVDHINPLFRKSNQEELNRYGIMKGKNSIENYNPSCGSCNSSKSTFSLEQWRKEIQQKKFRIVRDSSTFRILQRFGVVKITEDPIVFYFEKYNSNKDE